ncbi:hypothetical protein AT01_1779 [Yersinia aldovae 670-83]|nr:hypothetical protein AT01_1779 [Yersinia aldovae 670-83]
MGQIKRIIASILNKGVIVINNIENDYESEVIRLISDTFGAYMNEENKTLQVWLDAPFKFDKEAILAHAAWVREGFQASDDAALLMPELDVLLDFMQLSRDDRDRQGAKALLYGSKINEMNALLKVLMTYYQVQIKALKKEMD